MPKQNNNYILREIYNFLYDASNALRGYYFIHMKLANDSFHRTKRSSLADDHESELFKQ